MAERVCFGPSFQRGSVPSGREAQQQAAWAKAGSRESKLKRDQAINKLSKLTLRDALPPEGLYLLPKGSITSPNILPAVCSKA